MRAALAAAALLIWALADVSPALYRPGETIDTDVFHSGEMLLHRIKYRSTKENYHLPLSSVSAALLIRHSPAGADAVWRRLSAAAAFLLILALGCELGAPWLGLLGAGLLLFVSRFPLPVQLVESWHGSWGHLQAFYTLIVLVEAGLMVRFLREPTRARAWALALALGAGLLYRSTLVFFPPLLALLYWATLTRAPSREDWKTMALIGLAPYAFLLPWIATNWAVHHRLIPLEDGEASPIIIGGVLGAVEKEWARAPAALGITVQGTGETIAWAVRQVLARPGDYLLGYARRLGYIFLLNPLLFVFAALSFFLNRRKREFRALALLCAYWVLMHAFMSMLREYFDPLWPLLAAAAGAGAIPLLEQQGPQASPRKASGLALSVSLSVLIALCLFTYGTIAAYARDMSRVDAVAEAGRLDAAVARHPDEGLLYFERAMRRLEKGDAVADAVPDLTAAARLSPASAVIARTLLWTELYRRAAGGDGAAAGRLAKALLAEPMRPPSFLPALCARAQAHPGLAPVCLTDALSRAEAAGAGRDTVLRALAAAERLAPEPHDRRRMLRLYHKLKEHARAQAQLTKLIEVWPRSASLRLDRAQIAFEAGRPREALAFLDEARQRSPDSAELALIAALDRSVRNLAPLPEALALLSRSAAPKIDRAEAASRTGDAKATLELLAEAGSLEPDTAGRARMAAIYVERASFAALAKDRAAALALLAEARALGPSPALLSRMALLERDLESRAADELLRRAAAAARAGDRASALAGLSQAFKTGRDAGVRRRAAGIYAELKEFGLAAPLLDELIHAAPADAGLRVERASVAAAAGDRAAALAALSEARERHPGAPERRRMAYLHQDLGSPAAAQALFDALVEEDPKDATLRSDRGLCLYLNGRRKEAIAELETALKLEPGLKAASSTLAAIRAVP